MKHYRNRRRTLHRDKPSAFAWLLLILSWIVVLPVAGLVLMTLWNDCRQEPSVIEEAAEPVFAQKIDTPLEATYERIGAIQSLRGAEPTILIYHTHTTEAYLQSAQNPYRETSAWRTNDNTKNVVAVGETLTRILETQYGFRVVHDVTDHEPPKLATSYDRSLVTMEAYHKKYPSIVLFIDLHRDAYQDASKPADYLIINGKETARMMFVVGKGDKYTDKPYFEVNYALAERITEYLNSIDPKLARPIRIKSGRYNQHVSPNCLLVEIGHNANTLEQALSAVPYLAEAIAYAFRTDISRSVWAPN